MPKGEGSTIGAIIFLAIIVLVGAGIWWGVSSWMDGDDTTAVEESERELGGTDLPQDVWRSILGYQLITKRTIFFNQRI